MKRKVMFVTGMAFLLCSCAAPVRNGGGGAEVSGVLAPYADVRGMDGMVTVKSGDYVPEEMITYWFNQDTVFEEDKGLASDILENGKNPGLNVTQIHAQGITGENVTLAIIDQPLLLGHPEYENKIVKYHTIGVKKRDGDSSMHGPAVTSLLAGDTIGTAPGVKLYYVAIKTWDRSAPRMGAQALDWLIEQNEALPEADKIRAVSVSADFTNTKSFDDQSPWEEAVKRAGEAGILVLDCRKGYDTCVFWPSSLNPQDRDEIALSKMGTPDGSFTECPSGALGTPAGYRTTAEVYREGEYSYSYDAVGGHSWAVPYGAGVLALGWQVNPLLTGQEMLELMRESAYRNDDGDCFLNPVALIEAVRGTLQ